MVVGVVNHHQNKLVAAVVVDPMGHSGGLGQDVPAAEVDELLVLVPLQGLSSFASLRLLE